MDKFNIEIAIELLKKHIVLFTIIKNAKCYVFLKNNRINVINNKSSYRLTEEDFVYLYKDSFFYVVDETNNTEIDYEKDKEYYSWKQ